MNWCKEQCFLEAVVSLCEQQLYLRWLLLILRTQPHSPLTNPVSVVLCYSLSWSRLYVAHVYTSNVALPSSFGSFKVVVKEVRVDEHQVLLAFGFRVYLVLMLIFSLCGLCPVLCAELQWALLVVMSVKQSITTVCKESKFVLASCCFSQNLSRLSCAYKKENQTKMVVCDLGNPMKGGTKVSAHCDTDP